MFHLFLFLNKKKHVMILSRLKFKHIQFFGRGGGGPISLGLIYFTFQRPRVVSNIGDIIKT